MTKRTHFGIVGQRSPRVDELFCQAIEGLDIQRMKMDSRFHGNDVNMDEVFKNKKNTKQSHFGEKTKIGKANPFCCNKK